MLPLPQVKMDLSSPFNFYYKKNEFKKTVNKVSTLKWFNNFFNTVLTMLNKGPIIISSFPEITINEDDKNEAEELEIKKIVFEWMKQII